MLRLLAASLILLTGYPVTAFATMPTRAEVRHRIDRFVVEARASQNVREWIRTTHLFSRIDKEALLSPEQLPEKMPNIIRRFNDDELTVQIEGVTANFQNIAKGELILNGEKIHLQGRLDLATAFRLIDERVGPKISSRWPRWLYPERAEAEAIHPSCISSRWEFMKRSPTALLESNFGYVGKLFSAGIVVSSYNLLTGWTANCSKQVEDLRKILEQGKIGLKSIDCGTDPGGTDRSMDFWIPETDEKGAFKTRAFNLDYSQLLAQDALKEEGEDEEAKPTHKKDPALFVFDPVSSELQEVRVRKINHKQNRYYCENLAPGTPEFNKHQDDIEAFRRVFAYIGNNNSCYACYNQMSLKLRTPDAPAYFPKPQAPEKSGKKTPEKPGKKQTSKGKSKSKSKDEDDEPAARSAH